MNNAHALPSGSYRAASMKQVLTARLVGMAQRIWDAFDAHGRLRADSHLKFTAAQVQTSRPELAAELRRTAAALARPR